ncbi:MAG: nickel pincer cofactor biosynthesis protein LarB [Syntrophobacterales bacterium]|nr:nickel pincer cofactor biosynthesis protein LarB [Syntrophobacterales bacterium]
MDKKRIEELLEEVKAGDLPIAAAMERLRGLPYEEIGYAKLDTHRSLRNGFPEVVFCQGKTPEQAAQIVKKLSGQHEKIIATRVETNIADAISALVPEATYYPVARIMIVDKTRADNAAAVVNDKYIMVLTGGTADIPVAEEAAITAETMGSIVERSYDVGVAGLHRLLSQRDKIMRANVLVVVAGMEGALPSIVGGLVSRPVIAVPTSIGYGANFGGLSALLAMLNSCASGVVVVNIDNGFGAGYFAHLVNK